MGIREDQARYYKKVAQLRAQGSSWIAKAPVFEREGERVRVFIPEIDIPTFRHKEFQPLISEGGISDGKVRKNENDRNIGDNEFSAKNTGHQYRVLERSQAAQFVHEYLELPGLRSQFESRTTREMSQYRSISKVGPSGRRQFRRTYKETLKRQISLGTYEPGKPMIEEKQDRRYRSPRPTYEPSVVVIYLLDISGSTMGTLGFLQETAWWIDTLIEREYGLKKGHYIHYEALPQETTAELFYAIEPGGENNMGLSLALAHQLFGQYPSSDKYLVQLTDGDYADLEITQRSINAYTESGLPKMNMNIGNPLIDRIVGEVNAVFVIEAGAYYESAKRPIAGASAENYSTYIKRLKRERADLADRIRVSSDTIEEIYEHGIDLIPRTLRRLFRPELEEIK
ncbi:DUF444 family protein [Candidatus Micrarchaeota archaeon]|nr:DUF444 family protein [Candidatus Micrarchaeota archaeon]